MVKKLLVNYQGNLPKKFSNKTKFLVVVLALPLVFGIGPIIADQIAGNSNEVLNNETATVESSVSPTLSPEPIESQSVEAQETPAADENNSMSNGSTSTSQSPSPSPSKSPPHAIANQEMILKLPRVIKVDPRSKLATFPQVGFESVGSPYLMLCMSSTRHLMDVELKGIDDSFAGKEIFISGDRTSNIQISGLSDQVLTIFNGYGGLRISSSNGQGVVGTNLSLKFVAISEPTDNFDLCSSTANASQWNLEIQPLGLQVNTKKNPVDLGKKK